jgi:O-antigen/teichoic acid export membrane protein
MSLSGTIVKNVAFQYTSRVVGTIFGLATLAILTRYLGNTGFGQFTVATSYLQFVGTLVDFGLTITTVRMLAEPNADGKKILGNLLSLRLITAGIVFSLAIAIAFFLPWGSATQIAIAVGSLSFILLSIHQLFVGLFQKNLRLEYSSISEAVGRAVLFIAVAVTVYYNGGLMHIMLAMGLANLVMVGLSYIFARGIQPITLAFDKIIIVGIYKRSWPIALSIIFNLIYLRGDVMVMKIVGRPEAEIGYYGAAYKPLDVITVIPMIFMGLVLPVFVHAWETNDREKILRIVQRATDAVAILAFPVLVGGILLASPLILFISGPEYSASGPLLALLVIAAFMVFYGALYGHLIVGIGKQKLMTWVYAIDAVISIALYFYLIPRYGATSAAMITIFSETVIAVAGSAIVLKNISFLPHLGISLKAILSAIGMGLAVYCAGEMHVLLRILLGAIVYAILIYLTGAVSKNDMLRFTNKTQ